MSFLRAIDLCSGGGGWACAARGLPIRVVLAVDHWATACKTYSINHPETKVLCCDLRDPARQRDIVELAKGVDVVLGGIPCEWLSEYRKLVKVQDKERELERATLDSVLAMVKAIAPRWWCLEDVKHLAKELPLFTPWQEVNARGYSPQRRKRIFVGDFPKPTPGNSKEVMGDRLRPGPFRIGSRGWGRRPVTNRSFNRDTSLAAYPDHKSPTIAAISSRRDAELVVVDERLPGGTRQLEWQEAARLQGFPEDYLFYGSPTDVGVMVGRAVQIDTARAILSAMASAAFPEPASNGKHRKGGRQ